jgi:FG-GAP repeat protein
VGDQSDSNYGLADAMAGDVNGDGAQEIVVGAMLWSGRNRAGKAVLVIGMTRARP